MYVPLSSRQAVDAEENLFSMNDFLGDSVPQFIFV
jgi:hypothetical protein